MSPRYQRPESTSQIRPSERDRKTSLSVFRIDVELALNLRLPLTGAPSDTTSSVGSVATRIFGTRVSASFEAFATSSSATPASFRSRRAICTASRGTSSVFAQGPAASDAWNHIVPPSR